MMLCWTYDNISSLCYIWVVQHLDMSSGVRKYMTFSCRWSCKYCRCHMDISYRPLFHYILITFSSLRCPCCSSHNLAESFRDLALLLRYLFLWGSELVYLNLQHNWKYWLNVRNFVLLIFLCSITRLSIIEVNN